MTEQIQDYVEKEKVTLTQKSQAMQSMQERLNAKAKIIDNLERNYKQTWVKFDGTSLSDLELRIPDLTWEPTTWTGIGYIAYWSTAQEEDLGFNGDYSSPANKERTEILNKAQHEKEKFNWNYHRRQLDELTFRKNIQSAVKNLRKHLEHIENSDNWLDKYHYEERKPLLEYLEIQLAENLATPYSGQEGESSK